MKTIEQILEGVTAHGKWRTCQGIRPHVLRHGKLQIAAFHSATDANYASLAALNLPALVRAIEMVVKARRPHERKCVCVKCEAYDNAKKVLIKTLRKSHGDS